MRTTTVLQRGIVGVGIAALLTAWPATRPSAQFTPDFGFAFSAGGGDSDGGQSVATDAAGNVYTMGSFRGVVDFDPGPGTAKLLNTGLVDIFVAKYTAAGTLVWAMHVGGIIHILGGKGVALALDGQGNVYITGKLYMTPQETDAFVLKLDSSGNFVWARKMSGSGLGDEGRALALDGQGNVYTTGGFGSTADFAAPGTANLTSAGSTDVFVWKLDSSGNFIWARGMGGRSSDEGRDVALDGQGNVYTTGWFRSTADFDPGPGTANLASAGNSDVFVWKLDSSGNFVWARGMGGRSSDEGRALALDGQGNVYTTGGFGSTADFDPGPGTAILASAGMSDVFVSKLTQRPTLTRK